METENIFIAHTTNADQMEAHKAVVKAFKIKFEVANKSLYDEAFVDKIQESRKQIKEGKFIKVEKQDLEKFLGLQ